MIDSLTIVIPAFNEARRLPGTLRHLREYSEGRFGRIQVVVVDDGSTDGTGRTVAELGWGEVETVTHGRRRGKGAAVRTGVLAARNTWILVMDADMAVPIEEIESFAVAAAGAPIVIGSKRLPESQVDYPILRAVGSRLGHLCVSVLVVRGFRDTQCGFKLFRREEARRLFQIQRLDGFGFDFEVLYLARRYGVTVRELPVRCRDLSAGSISFGSYVNTLAEALRVAWYRVSGRYPPALDGAE